MEARSLRAGIVLAVVVLTAGCLGGGPAGDAAPSPTEDTPTATDVPTEYDHAANQPAAQQEVVLGNRWNQTVAMDLRVVRDATNETVHDETHQIDPGAERTVYNLSQADPDGIESFTIHLSARNTTEAVTVRTSACYGDAIGSVSEEGEVGLTYAVC